MSVTLSIKNVPEETARRLRERAAGNHRSLQGELLHIIETAVRSGERLSLADIAGQGERLGLSTPAESVQIVRQDRDRDDRR
mgnify:CR=1 FL=1